MRTKITNISVLGLYKCDKIVWSDTSCMCLE